ncbi:MAG: hypothetical protein HRU46_13455 [Verrucomicrobiales bacterium]|nr:hypothetical protein [Verrucomicrobiales bacterium]
MPRKRKGQSSKSRRVNPLIVVVSICAILLVAMVVGLVMVKSAIEGWLKGDEFRDLLVKKAGVVLKSEIEMADMTWQGSEVYSDKFRAAGYEDAAFSELGLDGVRATFGGIEEQAVMVPTVTVNRMSLLFSDKREKRPAGGGEDEVAVSGPELPSFLQRFVPNRVDLGEISVSSASVLVVDEAQGTKPFELSGVRGKFDPDLDTGMWEIKGQGGKLRLPDQPEIQLKDLAMRWRETELYIDRCALGIYEKGHVDGSGEISFADEGSFDLDLEISAIDIDELLEGEWKDRVNGTIEGPVTITGRPGEFLYEGTLNVVDAVVENIPVLTVIAKYTRNDQFEYLTLSQAKTDFRSDGEIIGLRNLELQADGLMRVEGDIDIKGEQIAGILQVGVTPGTLRWIPGAENLVFVEKRDGFLWAPMTLQGTLSEPQEDLSGRLIAAAGEAILKELPEGLLNEAQKFLDPSGESPDPGSIINQGKDLLDTLSPFLRGF